MKCVYINLEQATDRREALGRNFAQCAAPGWTLHRFAALDTAYVQSRPVPGKATPVERACFSSHHQVIAENCDDDAALFILEDNSLFCAKSCRLIDKAVAELDAAQPDWDILWVDAGLAPIAGMAELVKLKQKHYVGQNRLIFIDAKRLNIFGANASIINGKRKRHLLDRIDAITDINFAYDNFLKYLIDKGQIQGRMVVPFLVSLSIETAKASQIQTEDRARQLMLWNLFRRRLWVDEPEPREADILAQIDATTSPEAKAYGTIWGALAGIYYGLDRPKH